MSLCPHRVAGCVGKALDGVRVYRGEKATRAEAGRRKVRGQLCDACAREHRAIASVPRVKSTK